MAINVLMVITRINIHPKLSNPRRLNRVSKKAWRCAAS